jgi:nicotinate-nucleotide pyrophosphorylase (carboxylating)
VKATHLAFLPIEEAVARARRAARGAAVEVEVSTPARAVAAARAGAEALLLDNQTPRGARRIIRALRGAGLRRRVWLELSGGITPSNLPRYRSVGADAASLGSLTHSAPALPFHLRWVPSTVARRSPPR